MESVLRSPLPSTHTPPLLEVTRLQRPAPLLPSPAFGSAPAPRGQTGGGERTEFPSAGARASTANGQSLSVYGEKGEMEKAGRRRLASAAPPLGWLRRRESGADEDGLRARAAGNALAGSSLDDTPRSGGRSPWLPILPQDLGAPVCLAPEGRPPAAHRAFGGTRLERWGGSARRTQVTQSLGARGAIWQPPLGAPGVHTQK